MRGFFIICPYMKNKILDNLNKHEINLFLLPLISSSAVLRKNKILRELLALAAGMNFNSVKIYESLLQTYLFAGFPNALLSLQTAAEFFPVEHKIKNRDKVFRKEGEENCRKIYGGKFEKLIGNVSGFSPELADWLILEGYGKVFSREGLSLKDRELCNVSVLASLKYESQLYSHINGAVKVNNSYNDIRKLINLLQLTGGITVKNFGMKVFGKYLKQKGVNDILTP